ncbi:putative serine carboxypeptidase CPVL-like protein [Dinothrombium tinctorium]|uniref:Putative serine carboxypeptidase CPVL-like protein n=1 Tax=Dinothrombium tinctorium TaxID=1965070 RepID=A0A3S3SD05_9ACAR|nr:putative serine carboxypeptidase CPVL-like protein [Dinothrombium tinctorium]RWS13681.1 putative serine carboxypeptidase CPVL-like protein [Dinothrombium tinctorium]
MDSAILTTLLIVAVGLSNQDSCDGDNPLILTPMLNCGHIEMAKNMSFVRNLPQAKEIESYSGFFTVNKEFDSNMFFWFFPSKRKNDPVMLWLQGGPGLSSLLGLFSLNGPLKVDENMVISTRKYAWTRSLSMLYIDNPVGVGFSFTKSENGYSRNQMDVAHNLYEALKQFFTLFPEQRANDFYVAGQSYAGKYVPSLAYKIVTNKSFEINFKGIAYGNGFTHPISTLNYHSLLFNFGLIDEHQSLILKEKEDELKKMIAFKHFSAAYYMFGDVYASIRNFTGYTYVYNLVEHERPKDLDNFEQYVLLPETRQAIHVGNLTFKSYSRLVSIRLLEDLMDSVKHLLEFILNRNYKVLLYSGNLDIIVATPFIENFIQSLNWTHNKEYFSATRSLWKVNGNLAGFIKKAKNFAFVTVRNAGHLVPYDQPEAAFDMITRFVENKL